jgi:hypothetical protein
MPKDEEIRQMLGNPGLSDWFKRALVSALDRDPVDAANDAGLLSIVLDHRAQAIAADALAALVIRDARVRL